MYRNHSVGVIVPAYNEAGFVGDVVRDLPEFVDAVYLVDDASLDATWRDMGAVLNDQRRADADGEREWRRDQFGGRVAVAETAGKVTRLRHYENRGAGGAVKTGYLAALEDGVGVVATVDGDGQMDSARLRDVVDPVVDGRAGYAKGNRFADVDVFREMPPFRLFGNLLLTGLTRIASGYWTLSDPQNGFTAISRDALAAIDVVGVREYYGYMNDLMARLNAAGVHITDVPVPASYGDEESHIDYYEYVRRVSVLLVLAFLRRLWLKYGRRRQFPFVGYVAGGLITVGSALWWVLSKVTADEVSSESTVGGTAVGLTAVCAAALVDAHAEPYVVDGCPVHRRDETAREGPDWPDDEPRTSDQIGGPHGV